MKMTTRVPSGIGCQDNIETQLGTLHFFDGFPDDASVGPALSSDLYIATAQSGRSIWLPS
jgi:hypothetical protein